MHQVQLEKLGFQKAVQSIIDELEKTTKIFFSHDIENVNALLNYSQQINLYRIIQEAISNTIKHANAEDASVTVLKLKNRVITTILDNGKGFKASKSKEKSLGLRSMQERANLINGRLTINSNSNGTKIEIELTTRKAKIILYQTNPELVSINIHFKYFIILKKIKKSKF